MNIHQALESAGWNSSVSRELAESLADTASNTALSALPDAHALAEYFQLAGFAPARWERVAALRDRLASDPVTGLLWNALRRTLLHTPALLNKAPYEIKPLGRESGIFYLILGLSLIPEFLEDARHAKYPEHYALAAARRLPTMVCFHEEMMSGDFGLLPESLPFMVNFANGNCVRIGRFEYAAGFGNDDPLPWVFRHRTSRELAMLAPTGWRLDCNGFRPSRETVENACIVNTIRITSDWAEGIPVDTVRGRCRVGEYRRLDFAVWENLVSPDCVVPNFHIPGGGGMVTATCLESFHEARDFFSHYRHQEISSVVSNSWIFDPSIADALPDSNLAALQHEMLLFPERSSTEEGLYFVFNRREPPFQSGSSLREYFLAALKHGHPLRRTGALFLFQPLKMEGLNKNLFTA